MRLPWRWWEARTRSRTTAADPLPALFALPVPLSSLLFAQLPLQFACARPQTLRLFACSFYFLPCGFRRFSFPPSGLSGLSVSPRGVSAADLGAGRPLLISFTLRGTARVSVRVYDRRGVLVRRVVEDRPLTAGANLLTWDGRDEDGAVVADDLYFVAVEAEGQVAQLAVAVSRGAR